MLKQIELADFHFYVLKEPLTRSAWIPTGIPNPIGNFTLVVKPQTRVVHFPCPMSQFYTPFTKIKDQVSFCIKLYPITFSFAS